MTKSAKSKKAVPETSSYAIKGMDRQTWQRFVKRADDDGREVKWLILHFVKKYGNGEYTITEQH